MVIESLAALKRHIKPDMKIELVNAFFGFPDGIKEDLTHIGLGKIRKVKSNSSHLLVFNDESRLEWGIAKDYTLVNTWVNDELQTTGFIYDDTHRDPWGCRLVYTFR